VIRRFWLLVAPGTKWQHAAAVGYTVLAKARSNVCVGGLFSAVDSLPGVGLSASVAGLLEGAARSLSPLESSLKLYHNRPEKAPSSTLAASASTLPKGLFSCPLFVTDEKWALARGTNCRATWASLRERLPGRRDLHSYNYQSNKYPRMPLNPTQSTILAGT
jgi:hypothetical protein